MSEACASCVSRGKLCFRCTKPLQYLCDLLPCVSVTLGHVSSMKTQFKTSKEVMKDGERIFFVTVKISKKKEKKKKKNPHLGLLVPIVAGIWRGPVPTLNATSSLGG